MWKYYTLFLASALAQRRKDDHNIIDSSTQDPCRSLSDVNPCSRVPGGTTGTGQCRPLATPDSTLSAVQLCKDARGSWTSWLNRDNPGGFGDYEAYNLHSPAPCQDQLYPLYFEARDRVSLLPYQLTGELFTPSPPVNGVNCVNADQSDRRCLNYEVRFCCGVPACSAFDGNEEGCMEATCQSDPDQPCQWNKKKKTCSCQEAPPTAAPPTPCLTSPECKERGGKCMSREEAEQLVSTTNDYDIFEDLCPSRRCVCVARDPQPVDLCRRFDKYPDRCKQTKCPLADGSTGLCEYDDLKHTCTCPGSSTDPDPVGKCQLYNNNPDACVAHKCPLANGQLKPCEFDAATATCSCPSSEPQTCEDIQDPDICVQTDCPDNPDSKCHYNYNLHKCRCTDVTEPSRCEEVPLEKCRETACPRDADRRCVPKGDRCTCPEPLDPDPDPTNCERWTPWFDRDDPSGTGDWELLSDLRAENPGRICDRPSFIQARTRGSQVDATAAGQVLQVYDVNTGFACVNSQQLAGQPGCYDYEVRFCCDKKRVVATSERAICIWN